MSTADGQVNFSDRIEEALDEAMRIPWPMPGMICPEADRDRAISFLNKYIVTDEQIDKIVLGKSSKNTIKSDGSASSYYEYKHPDHKELQNVGDFMLYALYNDFDLASICKAEKRIAENMHGIPKEGSSIEYDLNKIEYHVGALRKRFCK